MQLYRDCEECGDEDVCEPILEGWYCPRCAAIVEKTFTAIGNFMLGRDPSEGNNRAAG